MKIRKKILCLLWIVCLLLPLPVYAVTTVSDGIEASILSPKDTYNNEDILDFNLQIKNINNFAVEITNIESTELENYKIGTVKLLNKSKKLNPQEQIEIGFSYSPVCIEPVNPDTPDSQMPESTKTDTDLSKETSKTETQLNKTDTDSNKGLSGTHTGDSSHLYLGFFIFFLSAAVIFFIIKKKNGRKMLSIILVVSLTLSTAIHAKAAESKIEKKFIVTKNIQIDNLQKTIQVEITYLVDTSNSSTENTVRFDLNYETDNRILTKTVLPGEYVSYDEDLIRENFLNTGWYTDPDCTPESYYNIRQQPVTSDLVLYAGWFDTTNTTDTDDDGIPDSLETFFHLDPTSSDTDNDGLPDYDELFQFDTDPLKKDTDDNGIEDGQEDNDNDQLNNLDELNHGTSPNNPDTDNDGITDYDEIMTYHTDPTKDDTDGDNANDLWEIDNGYDPLVYNDSFAITYRNEETSTDHPVSVSLSFTLSDGEADSFSVDEITEEDNAYIDPSIAGYLGNAYEFTVNGSFDSANMTFYYDSSLGMLSDEFQPRIYYFNEETNMMEELPDQIVEEGRISATITHFSMYILLNKVAFDTIWNTEIKPPAETEDSTLDITFVIDYSYSMTWNDPNNVRIQVTKQFIEKLRDTEDQAAIVKFIKKPTVVCEMTNDKQILKDAVDSIVTDNGYSTYSGTNGSAAIRSALDIMSQSSADNKYIVFLTDGQDTGTSYSYDDLIAEAKNNNIIIYSIGMDTASQDILTKIADETGGKYYQASPALDLSDIYYDIESETIDYVTDTNNDGICDYYTKLIQEGTFVPSNGSAKLSGIDLNYDKDGNLSDDYDGDGLKNGEELSVVIHEEYVTLEMHSNPLLADSDGDGLLDGDSQYAANGDRIAPKDPEPMKYNGERGMWKYHIDYSQIGNVIATEYDRSENTVDHLIRDNIYLIVSQIEKLPDGAADMLVQGILHLHNGLSDTSETWGEIAIIFKIVTINIPSLLTVNINGKQMSAAQLEAYLGSCFLNFIPDTMQQAYHSQPQTWQRKFGYNIFYDLIFEYGSNVTEPLMVPVVVDNDTYALWLWKGDYWNLQHGAEIGLYQYSDSYAGSFFGDSRIDHYHAVNFEVPMSLSLYYYGNSISNLFYWSPATEDQWWCTGFTGFMKDSSYPRPENLVSIGKVDFTNYEMILDKLKSAVPKKINKNFIFDDDNHTLWIIWR